MHSFTCLLEGTMYASSRTAIHSFLVLVLVLVVAVLGRWGIGSCHAGAAPIPIDTPTQLASVSVPDQPYSVAWSADGSYLAAGTTDAGKVFVVDVAKTTVIKTLKATGWVQGLAFSPDGKWLAVVTTRSTP